MPFSRACGFTSVFGRPCRNWNQGCPSKPEAPAREIPRSRFGLRSLTQQSSPIMALGTIFGVRPLSVPSHHSPSRRALASTHLGNNLLGGGSKARHEPSGRGSLR